MGMSAQSEKEHVDTNIDSWIYVTWGKCLESRACSWQWYHHQFGPRFLLSRRHLYVYYDQILYGREQRKALEAPQLKTDN